MSGLRLSVAGVLERLACARSRAMPEAEVVRPALIFAPHQDDETLGCGGLIALKRRGGAAVEVIFLTDGTSSHRKFLAVEEIAARRRDEALAACGELGVPAGSVTFLDFPDGELGSHRKQATNAVSDLLHSYADRQVFVPYRGDTTPDHIDTRRVVLDALARTGSATPRTVCEYPVWFWSHWPWVGQTPVRRMHLPRVFARSCSAAWQRLTDLTEFVDISSVLSDKEHALARHLSQTVRPVEHPDWPVLADVAGGDWLGLFFNGREYYHRYLLTGGKVGRG